MMHCVEVYGFGSFFGRHGKAHDIDILLVHENITESSCKFAIHCKSILKTYFSQAHVTILSDEEEQNLSFKEIGNAMWLGLLRADSLELDMADVVRFIVIADEARST